MKEYYDSCPVCGGKALIEDSENPSSPTIGTPVICENESCGNTGEVQYMGTGDDFCQWER